jgi:uncharacterized protein (DUF302 family)
MGNIKKIICNNSVNQLSDNFEEFILKKGLVLFNRINFALNATKFGLNIDPCEQIIFGNPGIGAALINENPEIGIDLPMKILFTNDKNGDVIACYNKPEFYAERHKLSQESINKLKQIESKILNEFFIENGIILQTLIIMIIWI